MTTSVRKELRRIAILNRGEAAMRFLRALREYDIEHGLAIQAVACATDPDERTAFVRVCDDVIHLGPPSRVRADGSSVSAYCDHDHVIAHLQAARCDAVWPGWGFASEDPAFVERLEAAGITFIGPSSRAMRLLGDKLASKRLAEACDVPLSPWRPLPDGADAGTLRDIAAAIGYPLMVKASAGGGGRGIRRVGGPDGLARAVVEARTEAAKAFGEGTLFIEACIERARHVEVQLVGGADGTATALGVRDCSIQRRHQKVVEEAPSPVLPPAVERTLCEAAVRLAEAAGYTSVGTAEFLYEPQSGRATLLEVNSRLQVEHTVTEMVTGCDLVKAQLDIARGLPWARPDGPPRGHAVEVRLYAEDPDQGFRPSPGLVRLFRVPAGPGTRVDSGITEGMSIAPDFDAMLAKVVAWGPTRATAIARLVRSLLELEVVVEDGATNKGFLLDLLGQRPFLSATADTAWLDRVMAKGGLGSPSFDLEALLFAAIVEYRVQRHADMQRFFGQAQSGIPRNLPAPDGLTVELRLRGRSHHIEVYALPRDHYLAGPAGSLFPVRVEPTGPHSAVLHKDGAHHQVLYSQGRTGTSVEVQGSMHLVERASGGVVRAKAPAMVVHVAVKEGSQVRPGDRLCTLEAMKMEMSVFATDGGVVRSVLCQANQQVISGQPLVVIDPEAQESQEPEPGLSVPTPAPRPLDALFPGGEPTPGALDALDDERAHAVVSDLVGAVRALFLGFDVPAPLLQRLLALLRDERPFGEVERPERWAALSTLLETFADVESLFDRNLLPVDGEAAAVSAELAFFELCRRYHEGEAGVPASILPLLRRALSAAGIRSIEPSDALREAIWRLAVARAHAESRHRLCSSLLRVVMELHEAGVRLDRWDELRVVLDRVAQVASDEHPFVADNARQAAYLLFEQSRYVGQQRSIEQMLDQVMDHWRNSALRGTSTQTSTAALARSPLSLLPLLVRRAHPSAPEAAQVGETLIRRLYLGQTCSLIDARPRGGHLLLRMTGDLLGGQTTITGLLALTTDLPRALTTLRAALREPVGCPRIAEVVLRGDAHDEGFGEAVARAVGEAALPADRLSRMTVTYSHGRAGLQHRTFEPASGALTEVTRLRDIHPEAARRIELHRLSEFSLERLPAPEQIYVFRARALSNPDDERIFGFAEVRDVPERPQRVESTEPLWEFEQAYFEALRVIRDDQSRRDPRRRLHWNRLTFYVRPVVTLTAHDVSLLAPRLAAPASGLGLEKVVVRARVANGQDRDVELVIRKSGRHRLEVHEREPSQLPIRAMTPYELKVVRARRLGAVYPYEVARMLEGRSPAFGATSSAVPHPDMARGHFVEHDLDATGERLVPTTRTAGENRAAVIVGTMTHYTAKHPDGMERVFIASDPTREMGALAEPECRRILAALDLAETRGLPVEWLPVSAGARIAMDSGTENLDWTARVLRRIIEFTNSGGHIHVIVSGVNVGAQSYWNAEATMLQHCRGVLIMTPEGSMVLTGKKALEYSGGVGAEDERGIGGFDRIMGPNGQAQYFARDLGDAYAILFEQYRYTYRAPGEPAPRPHPTADPLDRSILTAPYRAADGEPFSTVGDLFSERTNPGRKRPFAIREVMAAVIDQDGGHLERFRPMADAETAVVWDAHLGGFPACVIGFESRPLPRRGRIPLDGPETFSGGTLFPMSSKKVARAINAASGNRPVVVLANLSGFDGSPESLRNLQLEHGAEIGRAVTRFEGRIVFAVIGRYHGGAYVVFSKALNPNLVAIAVEGTYASVIGGAPAAAVVFPREVRRRAEADPRMAAARRELETASDPRKPRLRERLEALRGEIVLEKQGEVAREFDAVHTVQRAVEVGSLDAVVPAAELRGAIVRALGGGGSDRPASRLGADSTTGGA